MQEGPDQWAASLRWLCFSDTTLPLAAKEANRVLRQLSLGGPAAMQAGLHFAFEVTLLLLRSSPLAGTAANALLAVVMHPIALQQWQW